MSDPPSLKFFVPGQAVPQGSLRPIVSKSTGRAFIKNNPAVVDWRMKVTAHARQAVGLRDDALLFPMLGPIGVQLDFILKRPALHFGTGKNADVVKSSSPRYPAKAPDLDKLTRAIFDALTDARVWDDDGQVVWLRASEHWADDDLEGVHVTLGVMK